MWITTPPNGCLLVGEYNKLQQLHMPNSSCRVVVGCTYLYNIISFCTLTCGTVSSQWYLLTNKFSCLLLCLCYTLIWCETMINKSFTITCQVNTSLGLNNLCKICLITLSVHMVLTRDTNHTLLFIIYPNIWRHLVGSVLLIVLCIPFLSIWRHVVGSVLLIVVGGCFVLSYYVSLREFRVMVSVSHQQLFASGFHVFFMLFVLACA